MILSHHTLILNGLRSLHGPNWQLTGTVPVLSNCSAQTIKVSSASTLEEANRGQKKEIYRNRIDQQKILLVLTLHNCLSPSEIQSSIVSRTP